MKGCVRLILLLLITSRLQSFSWLPGFAERILSPEETTEEGGEGGGEKSAESGDAQGGGETSTETGDAQGGEDASPTLDTFLTKRVKLAIASDPDWSCEKIAEPEAIRCTHKNPNSQEAIDPDNIEIYLKTTGQTTKVTIKNDITARKKHLIEKVYRAKYLNNLLISQTAQFMNNAISQYANLYKIAARPLDLCYYATLGARAVGMGGSAAMIEKHACVVQSMEGSSMVGSAIARDAGEDTIHLRVHLYDTEFNVYFSKIYPEYSENYITTLLSNKAAKQRQNYKSLGDAGQSVASSIAKVCNGDYAQLSYMRSGVLGYIPNANSGVNTACPFTTSKILATRYNFGVYTDQTYIHLLIKNEYMQSELLEPTSDPYYDAATAAFLGSLLADVTEIRKDLSSAKEPKKCTLEGIQKAVEDAGFVKEEADGKTVYKKKLSTGSLEVTVTDMKEEVSVRAEMKFEGSSGLRQSQELIVLLENGFDEEARVKEMLRGFEIRANSGKAFV